MISSFTSPTLPPGQQLHSPPHRLLALDAPSAPAIGARLQRIDTAGPWRSSATQLMRWQLPPSEIQPHAIATRSRWVPGSVVILVNPVCGNYYFLNVGSGLDKIVNISIGEGRVPARSVWCKIVCTSVLCSLPALRISYLVPRCIPQPLGRCWACHLLDWALRAAAAVMRLAAGDVELYTSFRLCNN
jgi:hypothetical protein